MSKETFYFSHDYEPTSDPKIQALLGKHGAVGYGIYWRLIEMMHSDQDHKLPLKEYLFLAIAQQMLTSVELIKLIIKESIDIYELFESDGELFWSNRVLRNCELRIEISKKRSMAGKASAKARANRRSTSVQQVSTSVEHLSTGVQQNLTNGNKGKERKEKERKEYKEKKEKEKKESSDFSTFQNSKSSLDGNFDFEKMEGEFHLFNEKHPSKIVGKDLYFPDGTILKNYTVPKNMDFLYKDEEMARKSEAAYEANRLPEESDAMEIFKAQEKNADAREK